MYRHAACLLLWGQMRCSGHPLLVAVSQRPVEEFARGLLQVSGHDSTLECSDGTGTVQTSIIAQLEADSAVSQGEQTAVLTLWKIFVEAATQGRFEITGLLQVIPQTCAVRSV